MDRLPDKIAVSACLLGKRCRYNGGSCENGALIRELEGKTVIPICPEELGGLPTPRPSSRIVGDPESGGADVLAGRARVITSEGGDVTAEYIEGAQRTLALLNADNVTAAILKQNSPSCGCGRIYASDGCTKKNGDGITTALLKMNGIRVCSDDPPS